MRLPQLLATLQRQFTFDYDVAAEIERYRSYRQILQVPLL